MLSSKETAVLRVLLKYAAYYGKRYVFPNQKTIVKRCAEWFGEEMSRRTLNRVLGSLVEKGFFERVRRISKKLTGELWLRSTLYMLKGKAFGWLWSLKAFFNEVSGGFAVTKKAHHFFLKREDHQSSVDNSGIDDHFSSIRMDAPLILPT